MATDINNAGQIVGTYTDTAGKVHGFLDTNGVYKSIDVPGSTQTIPTGINNITQLQLYGFADFGWLHNIAPTAGTPANVDAASAGGGIRLSLQSPSSTFGSLSVDLSAAKAIDGPRDDWRFFLILGAKY